MNDEYLVQIHCLYGKCPVPSPWSYPVMSGASGSGIAETCPISAIKRASTKIICLTVKTPVDFLDWAVKYILMIYRRERWKGFFLIWTRMFFKINVYEAQLLNEKMSVCEENFNEKMGRLYKYFPSHKRINFPC